MKKEVRQIWDAIPMPNTVIVRVNALGQGNTNDLDFLDWNKNPIEELKITGVDARENEAPYIELIEPDIDINPISAVT